MISFKQDGSTLTPYWTGGDELSEKDWKKICAGVKRHFSPIHTKLVITVNISETERHLTDLLYAKVRENFNFLVPKPTPTREYHEMRLLLKEQKPQMVEAIINWSQQDSFWKQNIRSVKKLRLKFDDLLIRAASEQKAKNNKMVSV